MNQLLAKLLLTASLCLLISFSIGAQNPKVLIKTEAGDITVEVFSTQAPVTAANFLRYVKEKRYDGASFYRVLKLDNQPKDSVKIQILQGGLAPNFGNALPPIAHETTEKTGILHEEGTLSMVRQAPGSARSEFFISLTKQPHLDFGGKRNKDGQGFAAFGKVITGMEVVRKMHQAPVQGQLLAAPVKILSVTRM